ALAAIQDVRERLTLLTSALLSLPLDERLSTLLRDAREHLKDPEHQQVIFSLRDRIREQATRLFQAAHDAGVLRPDLPVNAIVAPSSQMGGQRKAVPMSLSPDRLPASQARPSTSSAPSSASGGFAIETHGLSKHFGKLTAVSGLTISVPVGTITGFIGPNGAGKTTTIRLLLGLVRPDAGSATILGQLLTNSFGYLPRVGALI